MGGLDCDPEIQELHKHTNHARVPKRHWEDGFKLGHWVQNQRSCKKNETLSNDRIRRLKSLPGRAWNLRGTPKR